MCQASPAVASDRDGSVALSLALVVTDMFCQEGGGGGTYCVVHVSIAESQRLLCCNHLLLACFAKQHCPVPNTKDAIEIRGLLLL